MVSFDQVVLSEVRKRFTFSISSKVLLLFFCLLLFKGFFGLV